MSYLADVLAGMGLEEYYASLAAQKPVEAPSPSSSNEDFEAVPVAVVNGNGKRSRSPAAAGDEKGKKAKIDTPVVDDSDDEDFEEVA